MRKNIVVCVLTAIGVFLFAFGYAGYADADFFSAVVEYLRDEPVEILGIEYKGEMLNDAGADLSPLEIEDWKIRRIMQTKVIGLLFITAGAVTLVAAFLFYRHSDKQ